MPTHKLTTVQSQAALSELNTGLPTPWEIIDGKLAKAFKFKDFQQAFGFMTMCALYAERQDHHPEWSNVYNKVAVQLITHDVSGLSEKDFDLAKKMESFAALHKA
ncbi:4a-hydroxytetrahydrobiopterin dehydratase [Maribrevibacterium harenarium]|uniref:Putative pterin-4-alpha-carbinolamine dehydratase n=1 Tax=Maribrevibacterium harenarium TaxID=2589817 RepID=A0A501WES8_9GAMM|nr:4a-hydroxytetrahydrobiopterin dehydratase [Maribrevibacterium harenarium]TPE47928.1 4a-hydroxytetrahydrobiopterin dehydratase [Maribrevibacterium harenarium]